MTIHTLLTHALGATLMVFGCTGGASTTKTSTASTAETATRPDAAPRQSEEEPPPYEFVVDAQEPTVDREDLARRVVYPHEAMVNGIEGTVYVRVLLDEWGKPLKYVIDRSDNEILNEAAANAVMAATYTPGVQNGKALKVWVTVPVTFKLE